MNERFDRDAHYRGVLTEAMARGAAAALPREVAPDAPWYAVQAAARSEWIAMRELAALGHPAFLPHVRGKRPHRGRMIATSDPLFPGYLFARIDDGGFEGVRQADGVIGIVRVAERFAVLPEGVIEALKGRCDASGCLLVAPAAASAFTWAVGEVVRLTGGPFCGFQGAVAAVDKSDRVSVHIDIFGRPTPVTVSSGEVEKASPPRKKRPREGRRERAPTVTNRTAPGEQGHEPC